MSLIQRRPIANDPNLIPRVKQYLEDNVHKTYVDVDEMTQSLKNRYQEYSRRQTNQFRILVEHAYKTVLHSYGLDSNPGSDIEDIGSDLEVMDDANNGNHVNNAINSLYMKKTPAAAPAGDSITIDVSSDDDDDNEKEPGEEVASNKQKTAAAAGPDKVTVTRISANGTKTTTTTEDLSTLLKVRPGPASQKKRRLEAIDEHEKQSAAALTSSKPSSSSTQQILTGSKPKKFKKEVYAKKSSVTFADVGGMDLKLKELCELIMHIKHPEMYNHIGLPPPRGFLLTGSPGSGKTLLAQAIAGQLDVLILEVPATELIAGVSGESEERIREIFEQATSFAPCVLFIDEIDAISSNRQTAQKDMERRIVAQLISSLDNLSKLKFGDQVLVIGATNRPDALDPALRRVGRFDHEISLGIPDRAAREQILKIIARNLKLEEPFNFDELAALTPGYVGADLLALATRAASSAIKRGILECEQRLLYDVDNFTVEPSIVNLDDDTSMDVDNNDIGKLEEKQQNAVDESSSPKPDVAANVVDGEVKPAEEEIKENVPESTSAVDVPQSNDAMETEDNEGPSTTTEVPAATVQPEESNKQQTPTEEQQQQQQQQSSANEIEEGEIPRKQPEIKLQLTLDDMLKWLQTDIQPISEEDLHKLAITRDDFLDALKHVQPSAKREGFITVPNVTWNDIGSLQDIRSELKLAILAPVKFPERLQKLGLQSPSGVLLCGPPGCGKTLLAKAVANEAGINFISVKGPELLNMYVGESERAVRQCFQRARNSAPCVIFFDEFDSLCPKRSDSGDNNASQRVVNQLLTEMDGIEDRKGVFLMAASNRPDIIDPAVLRPGRLDKILYVGLPQLDDRVDILKALTRITPPLDDDVNLFQIASKCDGFTGADLDGLIRQASLQALKESIDDSENIDELKVKSKHFYDALLKLKPSVNEQDRKNYEKLKEKYGSNAEI